MMTTTWDALLETTDAAIAAAATDAGLVDVATTTLATPVGSLLIAAIDDAIVRVAFDVEDHALVLAQLAARIGPRVVPVTTPVLVAAREQIEGYFAGTRASFDLPLDLRLARGPFRREVLVRLQDIPVGETRTYTQLATAAGRPTAVRAVGSGCATNPVPVVIPCHRVLRTGGDLGGYLGGIERKRWLLDHEQRLAS